MNRNQSRLKLTLVYTATLFGLGLFSIHPAKITAQDSTAHLKTTTIDSTTQIDLKQAIQIALANNSQIKQALLSLKDADKQVLSAWGEVMPDIATNMQYTRNVEIPVNFIPAKVFNPNAPADQLVPVQFGTDNNWSGGLTVSQTIFRGEALIGISSSSIYKLVQSESYRATMQQIVTQTRLAYYHVLIAEEQLNLERASINRLEHNLKDNKARYKAGLLDEYDVLRVEVQLSNERPKLTEAKYNLKNAYRKLKLILDFPLNAHFSVEGNLKSFEVKKIAAQDVENRSLKQVDRFVAFQQDTSQAVLQDALGLRGDLRVFDAQLQLKDREILADKSRYFPTISAHYSLMWNAAEPGRPNFFGTANQRARSQAIALSVSLPLFQGLKRNATLQRAEIQKKSLLVQQHFRKQQAKDEIISAKESVDQALETAEARKKAVAQAQRGYQIALSRLDNGVGSQLDVTNAELQYRAAEVNYAQLVFNYLTAKAQYDQAIGKVPFVDGNINN